MQEARAVVRGGVRGPRWVCAGLARAGPGAARSRGRGRHLACPGRSGRWPAIHMGLGRRALETETLVQPDVMQLSAEMLLCVEEPTNGLGKCRCC